MICLGPLAFLKRRDQVINMLVSDAHESAWLSGGTVVPGECEDSIFALPIHRRASLSLFSLCHVPHFFSLSFFHQTIPFHEFLLFRPLEVGVDHHCCLSLHTQYILFVNNPSTNFTVRRSDSTRQPHRTVASTCLLLGSNIPTLSQLCLHLSPLAIMGHEIITTQLRTMSNDLDQTQYRTSPRTSDYALDYLRCGSTDGLFSYSSSLYEFSLQLLD